jgi:hypothetical protein
MGYRGKLAEQQQARQLRRAGLSLAEIAASLGVARSSVSLWVRDVEFIPLPRPPRGRRRLLVRGDRDSGDAVREALPCRP